jgi:hypothetical protein
MTPEITDPQLLACAARSRAAREKLSPVTSQEAVMRQQARNNRQVGKPVHPNVIAFLRRLETGKD